MKKTINNYSYKVFNSFDDDMINEWKEFEKKSVSTIFQKFFFVSNWQKTINKNYNRKLFIIFLYNENKLILILPFIIKKILKIKTLEWIGEPFSDLNFPNIINDDKYIKENINYVLKKIFEENKEYFEFVYLKKQINFLNKNFFFNNLIHYNTHEENKMMIISEDFENYKNKSYFFNSSKFKKIMKNINKFKITYKSSFSHKNKEKFREDVFNFFLKNKSYKIQKTGKWDYTKYTKYVDFINLNLNDNHCIFDAIYLNNEIISANIGFIDNETYYYIFPSYDQNWAKISPGSINLYFLIDELFANKFCKKFDFTIGNEAYKEVWSNKSEYLFESYFVNSFKGYILLILIKFKNFIRNTQAFKIIKYFYRKIRK